MVVHYFNLTVKKLGMDRATSEDLAFSSQTWRESDEVGPEDCLSTVRPIGVAWG